MTIRRPASERGLGRMLRRLGLGKPPEARRRPIFPPRVDYTPSAILRDAVAAASTMPDGSDTPPALIAALAADIADRRAATGTIDGPAPPVATGLRIRTDGLPDWWVDGGNLLLAAPDADPAEIALGLLFQKPSTSLIVLGARARVARIVVSGGPALIVLGDRVNMVGGSIAAGGASTILIGEETSTAWASDIDARNGGMILVGADNMWAAHVSVRTDDGHTLLDAASGRRLNGFGNRIVIGRHVWLGAHAAVTGDSRIAEDCVVGHGSFVKHLDLAGGMLALGRPARAARSGITWSREDYRPV